MLLENSRENSAELQGKSLANWQRTRSLHVPKTRRNLKYFTKKIAELEKNPTQLELL
jgi:hypothetical protein